MKKYRRIEVNAYHRRVTVVSGEWRPDDLFGAQAEQTGDGVALDDSDACEPVPPDSPEGQLILVEAVRTLEQRLSPETRATLCGSQVILNSSEPNRNYFCLKFRSIYGLIPRSLRFTSKQKGTDAAKQSVKD